MKDIIYGYFIDTRLGVDLTKKTRRYHKMKQNTKRVNTTMEITICGLFIALTYVATAFVNLRIPFLAANGGLIHLGNVPVFIGASLFGKRCGAISGALGMALFDLSCGWVSWAPFTFVICGLIGYSFAHITFDNLTKTRLVIATVVAAIIKIVGYYITEGILYSNWIVPAASIPGNLVQIVVAGIITVPMVLALSSTVKHLIYA